MDPGRLQANLAAMPSGQAQQGSWMPPVEPVLNLPSDASTESQMSVTTQIPTTYDPNGNLTTNHSGFVHNYEQHSFHPAQTQSPYPGQQNYDPQYQAQQPSIGQYNNHGTYGSLSQASQALHHPIPRGGASHTFSREFPARFPSPAFPSNSMNSYHPMSGPHQSYYGMNNAGQYQYSQHQPGPHGSQSAFHTEYYNAGIQEHFSPQFRRSYRPSGRESRAVEDTHSFNRRPGNIRWAKRSKTPFSSAMINSSVGNAASMGHYHSDSAGTVREVLAKASSTTSSRSRGSSIGQGSDAAQSVTKPRSGTITASGSSGTHDRVFAVSHSRHKSDSHISNYSSFQPSSGFDVHTSSSYSNEPSPLNPYYGHGSRSQVVSDGYDSNHPSMAQHHNGSSSSQALIRCYPSPISPKSNALVLRRRDDQWEEYSPPTMAEAFPHGSIAQKFGVGNNLPVLMGPFGFSPSTHLLSILPNGDMTSLEPGFTNDNAPSFNVRRDGIKPTIDVLLDAGNMPFIELARQCGPVQYGVIRLSNIPYNVTRAEIIAFFGRSAKLVNDNEEPVHIIMERVTSKTMDAFVEFITVGEAANAVSRYEYSRMNGRGGRLGERHVEMELSSQEHLMKELFPKAKNVKWQDGIPEIIPRDLNDIINSGFKSFVSSEELVMMCKHVEFPHRSPFAKDCPQRPFECLISTLLKFPWYMVDYVTVKERNHLYEATMTLLRILQIRVQDGLHEVHLNEQLLRRVRRAAIRCPGFSEVMRDNICHLLGFSGEDAGLPMFANNWPFGAIGAKRNFSGDVLWYYINILRLGTTSAKSISLADQSAQGKLAKPVHEFGHTEVEYPAGAQEYSLSDIARIEWDLIEKILREFVGAESAQKMIE